MDNNALPRGIKKILFSRDEISNRIKELAHQIDEDFKGDTSFPEIKPSEWKVTYSSKENINIILS